MKEKIKISICIAVYNTSEYLKECFNSILVQKYNNYEIIVVDDASTDNSLEICNYYAKKNDKIRLFKNNKNMGPLYSKVFAISKATGDIIMFIDSDDYYEPNLFEIVIDEIKNVDMVLFGFNKVLNGKIINSIVDNNIEEYDKNDRKSMLKKLLYNTNYNSLCLKAVRSNAIKVLEFNSIDLDMRRSDDKYLSSLIYRNINSCKFLNKILYNYRSNPKGITISQKYNYILDFRSKESFKDLIYGDKIFDINDREEFDRYSYKSFKGQLIHIANLNKNRNEKINIFKQIKNEKYYKEYLLDIVKKYGLAIEFLLFNKNCYSLLIILSKIKKIIAGIIKYD